MFAMAQFVAKTSSAGIVVAELGFVPDAVIMFSDLGGTNPNQYYWMNNARVSLSPVALSILNTGSTGVLTRDTTGITAYTGGETIATTETTNDTTKHVNLAGTAATAGHVTAQGITIPADHQVAGGNHVVLAFKCDNQ